MKSILDTIKILPSIESGFEVPASKVLNYSGGLTLGRDPVCVYPVVSLRD